MSPLGKIIPHTAIWHKKDITSQKSSIGEVIFTDRDVKIRETSIMKHLGVCYRSFPATLNMKETHLEITCRKSVGGEFSITITEGIMIGCSSMGVSMKVGTVNCSNSILEIWIEFWIQVDVIWNGIAFEWRIDIFVVKGW